MIWYTPLTIDMLDTRAKGSCSDYLNISFVEVGNDFLVASMPVTKEILQPIGIVHGGMNVVLAETVASNAANAVVDNNTHYCVGLEINANHIRATKEGTLIAKTYPQHLGRTTQVWQIDINNDKGKCVCVARMTAAVIAR